MNTSSRTLVRKQTMCAAPHHSYDYFRSTSRPYIFCANSWRKHAKRGFHLLKPKRCFQTTRRRRGRRLLQQRLCPRWMSCSMRCSPLHDWRPHTRSRQRIRRLQHHFRRRPMSGTGTRGRQGRMQRSPGRPMSLLVARVQVEVRPRSLTTASRRPAAESCR